MASCAAARRQLSRIDESSESRLTREGSESAEPTTPLEGARAGHSQEKAARLAGVDRSYFGAIERGEFNISFDTLVKIGAGLGTKASALCARARLWH